MHEFDGKALIFMIFNNDAIKNELSGLLDTSRQARRHHLIFLLKIALAMFLILCFAGFAVGIGFVRGAIDAAPSLDIIDAAGICFSNLRRRRQSYADTCHGRQQPRRSQL